MADIDVTVYYNEDRLEALRKALEQKEDPSTVENKLGIWLDSLYEAFVPKNERVLIEEKIAAEEVQRAKEAEESKRFAVIRLRDKEGSYCFISELHTSFASAAMLYRATKKQSGNRHVSIQALAAMFLAHEPICESTYIAVSHAQQRDPRITAIMDFGLTSGSVSVRTGTDTAFKEYLLKDVSAAIYQVNRKRLLPRDGEIQFAHLLSGKEQDTFGQKRLI